MNILTNGYMVVDYNISESTHHSTLCILQTPKRLLWQTIKIQILSGSAWFAKIKAIFKD